MQQFETAAKLIIREGFISPVKIRDMKYFGDLFFVLL
jgi:hypothetical protein